MANSTIPNMKVLRLLRILFCFWVCFYFQSGAEGIEFCFDGSKEGYRLDSNVLKSIHAHSGEECIFQCVLQDQSCRSVNFRKTSTSEHNCEFLSAVASESPEQLKKNEQFDYYVLLQPTREPPDPLPSTILTPKTSTTQQLFSSCKDTLRNDPTRQNGVYHIQTNASAQIYPVYCHMDEILGCGESGWTLVMKTDGNASTFTYHSPLWTNQDVFAVNGGLDGLTKNETKLASYWSTPFTKICLGMTVNGETEWIKLNYTASSLYSLIVHGQYRATAAGRKTWKSLITGSSLQPYCNKEGFNIAHNKFKIRLGYYTNNQNSCSYSDSGIGFGILYESCSIKSDITCGNIAQCSLVDNGPKLTAAFGYILVQ